MIYQIGFPAVQVGVRQISDRMQTDQLAALYQLFVLLAADNQDPDLDQTADFANIEQLQIVRLAVVTVSFEIQHLSQIDLAVELVDLSESP